MNYKQLNGVSIREGFKSFNEANPHIFKAFENQALVAIKKGKKKLSAKLIINWIRWNEYLESTDRNFRINDAYQSYYARLFIGKHPHYKNIFELRKLRNESPGDYMNVDANGQISFN